LDAQTAAAIIVVIIVVALLFSLVGGIVLATFLNRGADAREKAYLTALKSEREARAQVEKERESERAEARKYREQSDSRMASMERELKEVKAELAVVKQRAEIERATLLNVLRLRSSTLSDAGYADDIPEAEDDRIKAWIVRHFRMDGDLELLAAKADFPITIPPGGLDARANWIVTWARQNGLAWNLAVAAKKMRPNVPPW